ncbi:MAG: hypothetical protein C4520_21455 [Candidatus Abyssobacteria bacterium SURF_5]|uniref:DUF3300 domain-containing protein n=1 Tax=Abyssobacteria bacterium (strain SURF_5) TaxID=2093360 RepID=A0A3A4MW12_ABYX5|nr:MAG: hypothetical protein C4520_21455 [Candidatus Abyssubacteria bacterium SURF_5]
MRKNSRFFFAGLLIAGFLFGAELPAFAQPHERAATRLHEKKSVGQLEYERMRNIIYDRDPFRYDRPYRRYPYYHFQRRFYYGHPYYGYRYPYGYKYPYAYRYPYGYRWPYTDPYDYFAAPDYLRPRDYGYFGYPPHYYRNYRYRAYWD